MCVPLRCPELGVSGFAFSSVSPGCAGGFLFQHFQLMLGVIHAAVCLLVKQASQPFSPSPAGFLFPVDANF